MFFLLVLPIVGILYCLKICISKCYNAIKTWFQQRSEIPYVQDYELERINDDDETDEEEEEGEYQRNDLNELDELDED